MLAQQASVWGPLGCLAPQPLPGLSGDLAVPAHQLLLNNNTFPEA